MNGNIRGIEFHSIIENIFGDVKGLNVSNQLQVDCPRCSELSGLPHGDGKHNLEINTAKNVFRCWSCQDPKFSGSLGKLIRLYGSHADYELYKSYKSILGNDYFWNDDDNEIEELLVKLPDEMIFFSKMSENNLEHFEAYNYLVNERKISRNVILKYRLGFCTTGKYAKRIIIPSYGINGEINYFVGRSYDPNEKKKKYDNPNSDKSKIIFNEGLINWDAMIFIVEGVFEMFRIPNAIPLLGKTISIALFHKLVELKPPVVILLDPDAYKNSIEAYYTLRSIYVDCEEKIKIIKLPTNEDLDELYRNQGIDAVLYAIKTARNLNVNDYFITKLQNPYDDRKRRYDANSKYFEWKSKGTRDII